MIFSVTWMCELEPGHRKILLLTFYDSYSITIVGLQNGYLDKATES